MVEKCKECGGLGGVPAGIGAFVFCVACNGTGNATASLNDVPETNFGDTQYREKLDALLDGHYPRDTDHIADVRNMVPKLTTEPPKVDNARRDDVCRNCKNTGKVYGYTEVRCKCQPDELDALQKENERLREAVKHA